MAAPYGAAYWRGEYCELAPLFYARIDETPFDGKPDRAAQPGINHRIMRAPYTLWGIGGIAAHISRGCTVCPADFTGERRALADWCGQQLWCIDVDNDAESLERCPRGLTEYDAVQRAKRKRLPLVLAYQSFNGSPDATPLEPSGLPVNEERYRLVFASEEPITDMGEAEAFGAFLLGMYPEADQSTVEPNRMFYGTDKEVWICHSWQVL